MSEYRLSPDEIAVIRAYADTNMNRCAAARKVYKSRSTLVYWLAQIKKHTGLDPKNFYDLAQLVQLAGKEDPPC